MANEYNTLITFESKNQIEFMRFYEFVREIKDIERYGIVNFKGMNFLNGGYATFEIKVVGYNDPGIEPFLKIIHDGFPDVSLYYTSTDRCDYYLTNDENGKYYPFHYEVEVYSDNPTVTHCARFVSESYEGIQDFLKRKYNYELGKGVSFVSNAILNAFNVKVSEYDVLC